MDAPPAIPQRREVALEIGVVLLVAWVPLLVAGVASYDAAHQESRPGLASIYFVIESLGSLALLFWIMRRSGLGWQAYGFRRLRGLDLIGGACIAYLMFAVTRVVQIWQHMFGLWDVLARLLPAQHNDGTAAHLPVIAAIPYVMVAVLMEEVLYRGYLCTRLRTLIGNVGSVLASALAFALPHVYLGGSAVVDVFGVGCALGGLTRLGRCLWMLVIGHFLYDAWVMGWPVLP